MTAHVEHFAAEVSQRRRRLGMTVLDVNRNGGPTAPTVAKAEAGELGDPRPSTLSKFDAALRWQPGSAASIYWDGKEPRPREVPARRRVALEPGPGRVSLPLDRVLALMRTQAQLNDMLRAASKTVATVELEPLVANLNAEISDIVGLFVTDLLEHNYTDNSTTIQPLLEYAFAELLAAPISAEDPDREDKLYRRWLLGNTDGISSAEAAAFHRRLSQRNATRKGTP